MNEAHDPRPAAHSSSPGQRNRNRKTWWIVGILVLALGVFAWVRVGILDLPSVPSGLTQAAAGLSGLEEMKKLDTLIWSMSESNIVPAISEAAMLVRRGIAKQHGGDTVAGLEDIRQGIRQEPNNLVLANA